MKSKMILKYWLKAKQIRPTDFAKQVGVSITIIYKGIHGKQRLSAATCEKIEKATDKKVSRTEAMWPELFEEEQERMFNSLMEKALQGGDPATPKE